MLFAWTTSSSDGRSACFADVPTGARRTPQLKPESARAPGRASNLASSAAIRLTRCGRLRAVDARLTLELRWHGAALDRRLDERHAALSDDATEWLRDLGWAVAVEVTYSPYGERGSVDILASRADLGTCLVVELKTEIVSIEELVRRLDAKSRLGGTIHFERAGWRPRQVARLVIVLEGSTNRRRVGRHAQALDTAFPDRTDRVRTWLRNPVGPMSGLVFMSPTHHQNAGSPVVRPTRVQRPQPALDGTSPRTNPGPRTARQDPAGAPIDRILPVGDRTSSRMQGMGRWERLRR